MSKRLFFVGVFDRFFFFEGLSDKVAMTSSESLLLVTGSSSSSLEEDVVST